MTAPRYHTNGLLNAPVSVSHTLGPPLPALPTLLPTARWGVGEQVKREAEEEFTRLPLCAWAASLAVRYAFSLSVRKYAACRRVSQGLKSDERKGLCETC